MSENYNPVTVDIHAYQGDEELLDMNVKLDHPDCINGKQARDEFRDMVVEWVVTWLQGGGSVEIAQ